jgi:ADP-ribose pyrophosphatase YjhB (NUDIX family)
MAQIIREETGIDKLTEAINLLLVYEFPRRLQPKQPGLDMTWGGLVLSIIDALEVAQQTDLSNLKKQLADGIKDIKIYSALPPQKKPQ